jgi:predicted RNase H-like nuclease (RuvC/YqgF family)
MDLKKQILVALGLDKEEVTLAWQSKLEDGTIVVSTAETLEAGVDETEEKEEASEEVKEEELAVVEDWEGMEKRIQNLEDAVADLKESKEGGDDDVEASEEMAEETIEPSKNPKTITTKEVKEFSAEEELENLKAENEKLKTELAESPADAPINTNKFSSERPTPTAQDFKRMTKQEKFLYELYK